MPIQDDPPHEGAPEWMVSYADMITILMAFFVVMFSMAGQKDAKHEDPVLSSLRRQFGRFSGPASNQLLPSGAGAVKVGTPKAVIPPKETKNPGLAGDHVRVMNVRQGDQVTIGGVIYFEPTATDLTEKQQAQLQTIAKDLGGKPQKIEIRGHTLNSPPTGNGKVTDNWDLAYQRCHKTMQYLISMGLDPHRIRIGVAAQYEPVYSGRDARQIEKNNRVEVFMLNEFSQEPRDADEIETGPPQPAKDRRPTETAAIDPEPKNN